MATYKFQLNGKAVTAESWDPEQPLLYVLRNALGQHGPLHEELSVGSGVQ